MLLDNNPQILDLTSLFVLLSFGLHHYLPDISIQDYLL